ncbi:MAG: Asp-tRNA(Asn)/Glu-tRNA(Gln) amidotransferase subunit GatC [Bdellovibrionales bacterium]|nr:Asp-tRNA(Asn)/Glu-tRNA(Gln) amidotransferase subunit GatC [Bdellovibrionales bacterium]
MTTKANVENLATLSRLLLSSEEKAALTQEVDAILTYVEKLNELDTSNVDPARQVHGVKNVYRKDRLKASQLRDRLLELAPDREGDFIRVPLVINQDGE